MASLRKHGHGNRGQPPAALSMVSESPLSAATTVKKPRETRRGSVLSAAIAEHYNRTNPLDHHDLHKMHDFGEFGDAGSDVPRWVKHPVIKGMVVAGLVVGALSPVLLKVGRAESEQRRKREHNDSFKKSNPEVAGLGEYQQNNFYCHAPFPGALDSLAYKTPHGSELRAIQVVTRNGDRAPCGVLPLENNVTWNCDAPDLYDPSGMPIEVTRVRDEPPSLPASLWNGNCWRCDVTGRGIAQQHMLGEALGSIYGNLLEMSPANLYVRTVDSETIQKGVRGLVRGLLTHAIDEGAVNIAAGLDRREDVLLPRLEACPRLAELWALAYSDPAWETFKENNQVLMDQLIDIISPAAAGDGPEDDSTSNAQGGSDREEDEEEAAGGGGASTRVAAGVMTGVRLPQTWEAKFDLFLDAVRTRSCNGFALPCSPRNASRCVTQEQANSLFSAGDASFHNKYLFQRGETATLYAGPLLALMLKNLGDLTGEPEVASEKDSQPAVKGTRTVQVYSGEVDTVGGILAALNVTDWAWPPYASNIVLELWRRTETETIPRAAGGQTEGEVFVRLLYNGRIVKPNFCQREECPLRTFKGHVMQFLLPEDLEVACRRRHDDLSSAPGVAASPGQYHSDATADAGTAAAAAAAAGETAAASAIGDGNKKRAPVRKAARGGGGRGAHGGR